MRCHHCGSENSDTAQICPGCGAKLWPGNARRQRSDEGFMAPPIGGGEHMPQVMAAELGYATMGERFLAFLCDTLFALVLGTAVGMLVRFVSMRDFDTEAGLIDWAIFFVYMTSSEVLFHRTLGKRLLGIQVRTDPPENGYPSLFRTLIRESIGKYVSGMILGIGFLVAIGHPKKQTWADRMAHTVVIRTRMFVVGIKTVLAVVLVLTSIAAPVLLTELRRSQVISMDDQLGSVEYQVDRLHQRILQSLFLHDARQIAEHQKRMAGLLPQLNEYDQRLAEEKRLIRERRMIGHWEYELAPPEAREQAVRLRQEISSLIRRYATEVAAFDPKAQKWSAIVGNRAELVLNVSNLNEQINQLPGPVVPYKVSYSGAH